MQDMPIYVCPSGRNLNSSLSVTIIDNLADNQLSSMAITMIKQAYPETRITHDDNWS